MSTMKSITSHVDMRDLYRNGSDRFDPLMTAYMVPFEEAFPDEDEREDRATYEGYFADDQFDWHMLALLSDDGEVLGGIQYQFLKKGTVWVEHVWLAPAHRNYMNFRKLLRTGQDTWRAAGGKRVVMEFNDRAKMTWDQLVADASAGLPTERRELLWSSLGIYILCDRFGNLPVYWQSGMPTTDANGQPVKGAPVKYLSLGFVSLEIGGNGKSVDMTGDTMTVQDYLDLCIEMHETIPGVDRETDEAIIHYRSELEAMMAAGEKVLTFAKLAHTRVARRVDLRFLSRDADAAELAKTA